MNKCYLIILLSLFLFLEVIGQSDWTRTNPGSGGAVSMLVGTIDGALLSASDLSGVYISSNDGESWEVIGAEKGLTDTHIFSIGVDYTDANNFLIGTASGIYKTSDKGQTVSKSTIEVVNGLGYIEAIELSISNPMIAYAAHHEWWNATLTLIKTIDGGDSWTITNFTGLPTDLNVLKLMVDANDENIVYALGGKGRFHCSLPLLYKSIDGGLNWSQIATNVGDILDFDLHPTNKDIAYVSTFSTNNCAVPMWQYVQGNETTGALFSSSDGGNSFQEIGPYTGMISVGTNANEISITNYLFPMDWSISPPAYNNSMGTWTTNDGGSTWAQTGFLPNWERGWPVYNYVYTSSFYGINPTIKKDRMNPSRKYACFGGFAWLSTNNGDDFTNVATKEVSPGQFLSTGMDNINGNWIDVSDANANIIYAGFYDLGFWYSRDHGDSWIFSLPDYQLYPDHVWALGGGSNANFVLNDPEREHVVWATFGKANKSTQGAIFKSTAYGENWQWSNNGLDYLGKNNHGMSIDINSPVNNRTLYVTQDGDVFKSINDGLDWVLVLANGGLKFTAVDNFNSQLIYAGGEAGFFRSTDGGITWTETGLPEMRYTQQIAGSVMQDDIVPTFGAPWASPPKEVWNGVFEIKVDPILANRVYASVYGREKGLYRSEDGGLTWIKLYTNSYMRGIAIDPDDYNQLFISSSLAYHSGTYEEQSLGVLRSRDGGASWVEYTSNMEWTFGGRMEIEHCSDKHLWAWSPGTGIQFRNIQDGPIEKICLPASIQVKIGKKK